MRTYTVNGVSFEYDETKLYLDFFVNETGYHLVQVDWNILLSQLQEGKYTAEQLEYDMTMMDRWIHDVPRKRHYRKMVKEGFNVLSGEFWFENVPDDEAEKYFDGLLNSGLLARHFIETFLPALAEKVKSDRHPAYNHYIDPSDGKNIAIAVTPGE